MKFFIVSILSAVIIFVLITQSDKQSLAVLAVPDFSPSVCTASTAPVPTGLLGLAALSVAEPETLSLIDDLGVELVRVEFRWDNIEPTRGEFHWEGFDNVVDELSARDIKILATIDHAPVWAHPIETLATDFGSFLEVFVQRYGNTIELYEIFNEPNLSGYGWAFASGNIDHDAKLYASMVVKANEVIRAQDPAALIVSGGLSPDNDPMLYTQHMYKHLEPECFDIFSFHPYGRAEHLVEEQKLWSDILAEQGDMNKPVWFAELGTSDEETVEAVLTQLDGQMDELNAVVWFSLRDLRPIGWNFGLVEHDWSKKTGYEQFKAVVRNHKK